MRVDAAESASTDGNSEQSDAEQGAPGADADASVSDAMEVAGPVGDAQQSANTDAAARGEPDAGATQTRSGHVVSLLRDIETDTKSSFPVLFARAGNAVYFVADHAYDRRDLFRTDGESVQRLAGATDALAPWSAPTALGALAGKLFFAAWNRTTPAQLGLWSSDGTLAGTQQIVGGLSATVREMAASGNLLYFMAEPPATASLRQLWRSDGTAAGTFMLAQVGLVGSEHPPAFAAAGGLIYFVMDTGSTRQLWRSDGSVAGTFTLARMPTDQPASLAVVGDKLFCLGFGTGASSAVRQVLTTDGSVAGTKSAFATNLAFPRLIASAGGSLYVAGLNAAQSFPMEVWTSAGGTAALTKLAVELTGPLGTSETHAYLTTAAGILQHDPGTGEMPLIHPFSAGQGANATMLVASHGAYIVQRISVEDATLHFATRAGSQRLLEHFRYSSLNVIGDTLYAAAFTPEHGEEPWVSRGTGASTRELADVHQGTQGSGSGPFVGVADAGLVLFPAKTRVLGAEPWVSEGNTDSTRVAQDVAAGAADAFRAHLGRVGDFAFFGSPDFATTYRVDRTGRVENVGRGPTFGQPSSLFAGNRVHIFLSDEVYTAALQELTGATPTFANAARLAQGAHYVRQGALQRGNIDYVLIQSSSQQSSVPYGTYSTLFRWSASEQYPTRVVDVSSDYYPGMLVPLGDDIYYRSAKELWRFDSNESSTPLTQLQAQGGSVRTIFETTFRGALYFYAASNASSAGSLYATSGGVPMEMGGARPSGIAAAGERLVLCDGESVWSTDGSPTNTRMLIALRLPRPSECVTHAGVAYFAADDGLHGVELWRSDGTLEGTYMESDIDPGQRGSDPGELYSAGGTPYFRADHARYDREPWVLR